MSNEYPDPSKVISPKWAVKSVRVIEDCGAGQHAIARLMYDGRNVLACRWNGGDGEPNGHPNSRGIPTWFVIPDLMADDILRGLILRSKDKVVVCDEVERIRKECDFMSQNRHGTWINTIPLSGSISLVDANLIVEIISHDDDFKNKKIHPFDTDADGCKSLNPIKSLNGQFNITLYHSVE